MSKHIPGPWKAVQRKWGYPDYEGGPIIRLWDVYAGSCVISTGTIYGDSEANARLIAAAPELLAALQGCVNLLREVYGMLNPEATGNETLEDWLKEAKTAIAKAEGKHD